MKLMSEMPYFPHFKTHVFLGRPFLDDRLSCNAVQKLQWPLAGKLSLRLPLAVDKRLHQPLSARRSGKHCPNTPMLRLTDSFSGNSSHCRSRAFCARRASGPHSSRPPRFSRPRHRGRLRARPRRPAPRPAPSAASIFSAVIISQRARPQPISRGSNAAWMTRGNPDPDLGHAELRVVRRNPEIAGGGEFEAAAEAPARHPRDHRRRECPHRFAEIAQAGDEFLRGRLVEPGHFLDVGAADHALFALAGDDQHADLPFRRQHLQPLADAVDDRRSQDIERAGVADRQSTTPRGSRSTPQ